MKALIKRASLSILLSVFAPFAALADLIDAQRALLMDSFRKPWNLRMTSRIHTPLMRP